MKVDGIPESFPETVCRVGQGAACCSYLCVGPGGLMCAKSEPGLASMIEERRIEGSMVAKSNNCTGFPDFSPYLETLDEGRAH